MNIFKFYECLWRHLKKIQSLLAVCLLALYALPACPRAAAGQGLDPEQPLCFFNSVANKMLKATFGFGVTRIPAYTNGCFVYSPSENRILQLAANICDAATNSLYPDVFRPIFEHDNSGNVFICGFTNLSSSAGPNTVSGSLDLQFIAPLDIESLANWGPADEPILENGWPVNVYGVPWIIGAKKHMPGFSQLTLLNVVTAVRELQCIRSAVPDPIFTNHMYLLSITNYIGASFWNSYSNDYSSSNGLTLLFSDTAQLTLTNSDLPGENMTEVFTQSFVFKTNLWPGSHWSGLIGEMPSQNSFISDSWANTFLPGTIYKTGAKVYAQITDPDPFETNNTKCDPLPQFGLITTNWFRAIILDGNHVLDYVQIRGPTDATNITTCIADPDTTSTFYLWSTNTVSGTSSPSRGYVDQIEISKGAFPFLGPEAIWFPVGYPSILTSVELGELYFSAFFTPQHSISFDGSVFYSTNLSIQAGFVAIRTIFLPYIYQINDPLVHYLSSDLDTKQGVVWHNFESLTNGIWVQNNGVGASYPIPVSPYGADIISGRYRPWGDFFQTPAEAFDMEIKDPGVWNPDYWIFPTNLLNDPAGLGQVHRGTPWQTVYLKAGNILDTATNPWASWTGDPDPEDAALMAPTNDWNLAALLAAMLNTNNPTRLMSVNDSNVNDWLNTLNGLNVLSNSSTLSGFLLHNGAPIPSPAFDDYVMADNSAQAATIAGLVRNQAAAGGYAFRSTGDILSVSALTVDSPWLDTTNLEQQYYGLTDAAYEAIPSQLLFLLRPDSVGNAHWTNGCLDFQFSGSDAYYYELQQSSDLIHWTAVSTNQPVENSFQFTIPAVSGAARMYYRTVLLP